MSDYIDRAKAVNALNDAQIEYDENYKGLGMAKQIISDLPFVTEKPKIWIICLNDNDFCYCPVCKYKFDVDRLKMVWGSYRFPPHCPNCGAELKGE